MALAVAHSPSVPRKCPHQLATMLLSKFFKDLPIVIVIRRKRPQETGTSTSHSSPPTSDSPKNTKCRLSEAGDIIQLVSPMVQAAAGAVPVAGPPLKAVVDGLLYIIQIIDVGRLFYFAAFLLIPLQKKTRNKADLDDLASRVRRLLDFLSQEPQPRDEEEARRRTDLAR